MNWFQPSKSKLQVDDLEESVPLNAWSDSLEDTTVEADAGRKDDTKSVTPSSWKRRRFVLIVFGLTVSFYLIHYLYSDPERWDSSLYSYITAPSSIAVSPLVRASGKKYLGERSDSKVQYWSYIGIPYALPPIGDKRFRVAVPVAVDEWSEEEWNDMNVTETKHFDQGCPRPDASDPTRQRFIGVEDCLRLNIFTPTRRLVDEKLPVMVWIHGGGFYAGRSNELQYNPVDLMHRSQSMNLPIVMVSLNYRLSTLGFSSTPPPPAPPPIAVHVPMQPAKALDLNVGLKDQLEALKWIRREISNFGGDPDKVTLVGGSAGAISIGLHQLFSPPELFRGAFMMSGAPTSFPVPWPHNAASRTLHPLVATSSCPAPVHGTSGGPPSNDLLIACLRSLPLDELMRASKVLLDGAAHNGVFPWYPVIEGDFEGSWLKVRPSEMIVRGGLKKIPVVMGSVLDEGTRFTGVEIKDEKSLLSILEGIFPFTYGSIREIMTPILEFYPLIPSMGSPYRTGDALFDLPAEYKRTASLIGDLLFQAPRRLVLREGPKDFGTPNWAYVFTERGESDDRRMGVRHGIDVWSWFGHPISKHVEAKHLSRHMSAYLINFVAHLDPNGPGLHHWPQYGTAQRQLSFARYNITVTVDDDRTEGIQFINGNNPGFDR